ncbi:hypothetical protein M409DRAFT_38227 [Zasmidium cellare ATCC 36951]|uniref:non-specific serine/threonine protein kinase n=1 Tax=Zasmidium cellare ATCC 36951 TaxID=1080233 RepID=A0A6A6BY44_ZASCE|nr:uncharacterized protein M409DRAFT_38227 [Zasmidium cellare ATCC 36951]KAF2158472.1 hypothetical protein M409DRAFT_38227 [Zasmidium cellare ATCC 36951]
MSTPTQFCIPSICAEELASRLETEVVRRQDETPPPKFQQPNPQQSYEYICEVEHAKRSAKEVDEIREAIEVPSYWECEARHLCAELLTQIFQEHCMADWKRTRHNIARRLQRAGYSRDRVRACRQSIEDQNYWKDEADQLRVDSALQEGKLIATFLAKGDTQRHCNKEANGRGSLPQGRPHRQRDTDLSVFVVIFGNITGSTNFAKIPTNKRYEFCRPQSSEGPQAEWRGAQTCKLFGPFLGLAFGENMFSPDGWILGSSDDPDVCDIQLAKDNRSGISRRHLRIDLSPGSHNPRFTNISKNPVQVHVDADERKRDRTVVLNQTDSLELTSPITIDLGEITFRVWQPSLSASGKRNYRANAEKFSKEFMESLPRPSGYTDPSVGASTFHVRLGQHKAVYKLEQTGTSSAGTFASVMRVNELHSGEVFAAKVPHFKMADSAGLVRKRWESLTQEFKNLASLRHPHIVETIEVVTGWHMNEPPWLIMEWIPCDLTSFDLDRRDSPKLLLHLASGLSFMHSKGFTHRDLKPDNVLVVQHGQRLLTAKIADFGTAKFDALGSMKTYAGSSIYVAPEFWTPETRYTNAVDMWSLGIIATQYLTEYDARSNAWSSDCPPSRIQHESWIRRLTESHVVTATMNVRLLLEGLLCEDSTKRWRAVETENWLKDMLDENPKTSDGQDTVRAGKDNEVDDA